ncbi:MAG: hypothetical protein RQ746_09125 [Bacteroidales bacterium]|nr:hypothetical protein [Bacteroidales bacterium]
MLRKTIILLLLAGATALLYHCRPERSYIEESDAKLQFSLDTVYFDTIFTTVGTTTRSFRVYNPHSRFIKIDDIRLAGDSSVFRINVDGKPGKLFENYEIAPNDSMYVFVEATLDPNLQGILRIQDSITFSVNGNLQDVDLVAWGQNVHMLRDSVLDYSTTWMADKPYLIIDYLLVDTLQELVIEEGVKIYMHRDAGIFVKGSLKMNGSLENPIVVQGDRLEREFQDDPGYPGQWFGIYFAPGSYSNVIDNALIINGTFGLWADSVVNFDAPVLTVKNTEINRMSYDGILGRGTTIEAVNTVIGDCGNSCVELLYEGSYSFNHCTLANYWPQWASNRKTPALYIANYFAIQDSPGEVIVVTRDIEKAEFTNSIVYGSRPNEILVSRSEEGLLNYKFDKVLAKLDATVYDYNFDPNFIGIISNEDPLFDSLRVSYELDSLSPAIDQGRLEYAIGADLDKKGDFRTADEAPDLGAFERIE